MTPQTETSTAEMAHTDTANIIQTLRPEHHAYTGLWGRVDFVLVAKQLSHAIRLSKHLAKIFHSKQIIER